MLEQRFSDNDQSRRDVPSFIEPRPPLISNPFMRPRPQKGTNLLELFEEDSQIEEPELVQVYLRLKPYNSVNNLYEVRSDRCLITTVDTATAGHGRRTQHNVSKMYTFSHIFRPNSTQKEIFEHVVKDNLKKLPDGHNFTLLTYGASGSGKTFTLMGTVAAPGLVPRSLEYVFKVVDAAQQPLYKPSEGGSEKLSYAEQEYELQWVKKFKHVSQMASLRDKYRRMSAQLNNDFTISSIDLSNRVRHYVWVSFVEIYNESIYDLLEAADRRTMSKLRIREDSDGNVFVQGATQAFVRSGEEAYDVMVTGKHNLQVAATGVHAQSSRSHCIFTITMLTETDSGVRTSCVRLCDLAGCERARRTRNTGARMQESRAINSSLHVLERCLHMLRRKQRQRQTCGPVALVPYRESKLTRLLGAGLSGARGEAVSMVVTLNPAPEYQHETKHVLQLAAVARDIQVNNTIAESTLESSTQDTTIDSSAEVMRLRADNERLHFELVQAQSRNKELAAAMEERQQEAANTMRELVEEAKDMTRQYYEAQLQALREEKDDMAEEYESRLNKAAAPPSSTGTPSRSLQNKISELMTEIAILEEKLTAERLARARAEEEVQHLRACIEERDEKAFENDAENPEDVVLTDSENDSDEEPDDICDESLEPTFKKEDINRSRMLRQSLALQQTSFNNTQHTMEDIGEENDESVLEKSGNTLKDDSCNVTTKDSIYLTGEDSELSKKTEESHNTDSDRNDDNQSCEEHKFEVDARGTYFVKDDEKSITVRDDERSFTEKDNETSITEVHDAPVEKQSSIPRGTYFVRESEFIDSANSLTDNEADEVVNKDISFKHEEVNSFKPEEINTKIDEIEEIPKHSETLELNAEIKTNIPSETLVSKIIKSFKTNKNSDNSLAQFEQLEIAANTCDNNSLRESNDEFSNIKMLKEKRIYFDDNVKAVPLSNKKLEDSSKIALNKITIQDKDNPRDDITNEFLKVAKEKRTYFDNIDAHIGIEPKKAADIIEGLKSDDIRSPSIVKDDVTNDFEPSKIKKLLGESMTRPDTIPVNHVAKITRNKQESIDIFDSPQIKIKENLGNVELARQSIEKLVIKQKIKVADVEQPTVEEGSKACITSNKDKNPDSQIVANINSTIDEFENIYKDITAPRATEFELLISQSNINETQPSINEEIKTDIKIEPKHVEPESEVKYNLRHKSNKMDKSIEDKKQIKKVEVEEILQESHAKCESKAKATKRNLRLRRRKNQAEEEKSDQEGDKLKDIVNLQTEFSDVCMDLPAPKREVKDIPSPERMGENENVAPPMFGIQSCPSKSVTRSRRKLFTPRAEPLEESLSQTGDSNERICVPRPSYHRARARRRL